MKYVYAIRDRVADALAGNEQFALFIFRTDQQAIRYFADSVATEKTILNQHPTDFELIKLGELNDNGRLTVNGTHPVIILTGEALMAARNPDEQTK